MKKYKKSTSLRNSAVFLFLSAVLTMTIFSCSFENSGGEGNLVTVSFDLNGGTLNGERTVMSVTGISGEPVQLPSGLKTGGLRSPVPLGTQHIDQLPQELRRWYPTLPKVFPYEDMTCKADWQEMEKVHVTFDLNGGTYTLRNRPYTGTISLEGYSTLDWTDSNGVRFGEYNHSNLQSPDGRTVNWKAEYEDGSPALLWKRDLSNAAEFFNNYKFDKNVTYTAEWKSELRPFPKAIELGVGSKYYLDVQGWGAESLVVPNGVGYNAGAKILENAPATATEVRISGGSTKHDESFMIQSVEVSNDSLVIPGDGSGRRVFHLGGKTYTFKEVKTFHFEENSPPGGFENTDFIWDKNNQNNSNGLNSTGWRDSKVKGSSENTWHTIGVQLTNNNSARIIIPVSHIGEFDYVEYSLNYYVIGGANLRPKVVVRRRNNGQTAENLVLKRYTTSAGGSVGIGFGDWDVGASNNDTGDFYMPVMRDIASNQDKKFGSFDYQNARERYVICGGWNSKNSDDAILFSQYAELATLGNQIAVLYKNTNTRQLYEAGNSVVLEVSKDGGGDNIRVNFDYIAFYKLESIN